MKLLVLASLITVALCSGGWSSQDPTDEKWMKMLQGWNTLLTLPQNIQLLSVSQQVKTFNSFGNRAFEFQL